MNNIINKTRIFQSAFLILSIVILNSCEWVPLEDFNIKTAKIPVNVDWQLSGLNKGDTQTYTIRFFPKEKGKEVISKVVSNEKNPKVELPVGLYSVIVFNKTTEPKDWNSVQFENTDSYEDFSIVMSPEDTPSDALAVWTDDNFEVNEETVKKTADVQSGGGNIYESTIANIELNKIRNIKPLPQSFEVNAKIHIANSDYCNKITASFDDVIGKINPGNKQASPETYYKEIKAGSISAKTSSHSSMDISFNCLGLKNARNGKYSFIVNALTTWGEKIEFPITTDIVISGKHIELGKSSPINIEIPKMIDDTDIDDWKDDEIIVGE